MTQQLSQEAFARVREFIREQARPLDRARFAYFFEQGPASAVVDALLDYQNPDGGFGHALEPDLRAAASSVIATTRAFDVYRQIDAGVDTKGVREGIAYLLAAYDERRLVWPIVPPEVEEAPHAPWWTFEETEEAFEGFHANPFASVVGHLQQYSELVPAAFLETVRQRAVQHLIGQPDEMEQHEIHCYIDLLTADGLPAMDYDLMLAKLRAVVVECVATDPAKWDEYCLRPLDVVSSPDSPLAPALDDAVINAQLDYEIRRLQPDGSWPLAWSWDFVDGAAWAAAEREWKGHLAVEKLRTLRAFGRIEGMAAR